MKQLRLYISNDNWRFLKQQTKSDDKLSDTVNKLLTYYREYEINECDEVPEEPEGKYDFTDREYDNAKDEGEL